MSDAVKRLIEAAKEVSDYFDDDYACVLRLGDIAIEAEQQAADDAEPYSDDWAISEFGAWFLRVGSVGLLFMPKGVCFNGAESPCSEINTRGQLRKLIAALKGE